MEGWQGYRPTPRDVGRAMVLHGYEIERARIPEYITDDQLQYIDWWFKWKKFGFPFSGGWAEQPAIYMDVIETLEAEIDKLAAEKKKIAESKRGKRHR